MKSPSPLTAKKREEAKKTRRFYFELKWYKSKKNLGNATNRDFT